MKPVKIDKAFKALQEGNKVLVSCHTNEIDIDEIWKLGTNINIDTEIKLDIILSGKYFVLETNAEDGEQ